jgi:hypothetical protein
MAVKWKIAVYIDPLLNMIYTKIKNKKAFNKYHAGRIEQCCKKTVQMIKRAA